MISIQSLRKEFSGNVAVNDVDIDVDAPQMLGVIGRSGAGKSTLLRMINRLTPPTSGKVIIDGVDVLALKGKGVRRWQSDCAMIFQQFNLVPRLDVLTNVMLGRLYGQSVVRTTLKFFTREERFEALQLLDRFGIAQTALQRAETLSGGQQQRVALCRAMMQRPKMILADEPIASLDPLNARLVMEALAAIQKEEGIIVMCNLHTLDTARTYCNRIVGMRDGVKVFDGAASTLTDTAAREIYGAEANEAFEGSVTSTSFDAIGQQAAAE